MVNQGEIITFTGYFQQKVSGEWVYITPLKNTSTQVMIYDIVAMVVNETKNKKFMFTTMGSNPNISIITSTEIQQSGSYIQEYQFTISAEQTAQMLGDCTIEVSLISYADSDTSHDNPIPLITDNKGTFVIQDSLLGRTLAAE